MKKHIQVFCHGGIAVDPTYLSPWEDVWVRYKAKPGRKVYQFGPTLLCAAELRSDLAMHASIRADHQEPEWYLDDDADIQALLDTLQTRPYAYSDRCVSCPTIVTPAKGLDRAEAERMLSWWFGHSQDMHHLKFDWQKPKIVVLPTGFGNYD